MATSTALGFRKDIHFFGVAKSYLSVFVFASLPHLYWRFHAVGMFIMLPLQVGISTI
jgi:hypothetical protein